MYDSGTGRMLLVRNLNTPDYLSVILETIERELNKKNKGLTIHFKTDEIPHFYELKILYDTKTYRIVLNPDFIRQIKAEGPYIVDRFLWRYLADFNFQTAENSPYLERVFGPEWKTHFNQLKRT